MLSTFQLCRGGNVEKVGSARSWLSCARVIRQRQSAFRSILVATIVAVLLALCEPLAAQVRFGGVVGTVTDAAGASVPDATVTLMNVGTNEKRTSTTGQNGNYTFPNVNAGRYRLEIEKT